MTLRTRILFFILALLTAILAGYTLYSSEAIRNPNEPVRIPDGTETALLYAMQVGVPAEWVLQTAWLESHFDESLVGGAGEVGQFQLNPRWIHDVAKATPQERARIAVDLLAGYRKLYGNNWTIVRAAYMSPVRAAALWSAGA